MAEVFLNTLTYLIIIGLGFFLKKIKLLGDNVANVIMALILNLTLPCLLINSSVDSSLTSDMIIFMFLGILTNLSAIGLSLFLSRKDNDQLYRGVKLLASSGIDVGDFVLPFIQAFYPGMGVMILCIYNIGNTLMNSGGNYAIAAKISASGEKFGLIDFSRCLFPHQLHHCHLMAKLCKHCPEQVFCSYFKA